MNTSARRSLQPRDTAQATLKHGSNGSDSRVTTETSLSCDMLQSVRKIRVRVDSGNRAWRDGLASMLENHAGLEMLNG